MLLRCAIALLFAGVSLTPVSLGQQITSDVVISGASLNDGYTGWTTCDVDGQVYRWPGGRGTSVMRVARDGSTLVFTLPASEETIGILAPTPPGLAVLNTSYSKADGITYHMYRFDGQGSLLTEHPVSIDFNPSAMTATSSGKTIIVGHRPQNESEARAQEYRGAVLDADDQVVQLFRLPTTEGERWIPVGHRMVGGDGVAYLMLKSSAGPVFSLATISESGQVNIALIPSAPVSDTRRHIDWLFGRGVVVDLYQFPGEKPPGTARLDVYDLASAKKTGSKVLQSVGFAPACYLGDEFSVLAHSAHVEPSRGLPPDALRLVTVKLQ